MLSSSNDGDVHNASFPRGGLKVSLHAIGVPSHLLYYNAYYTKWEESMHPAPHLKMRFLFKRPRERSYSLKIPRTRKKLNAFEGVSTTALPAIYGTYPYHINHHEGNDEE